MRFNFNTTHYTASQTLKVLNPETAFHTGWISPQSKIHLNPLCLINNKMRDSKLMNIQVQTLVWHKSMYRYFINYGEIELSWNVLQGLVETGCCKALLLWQCGVRRRLFLQTSEKMFKSHRSSWWHHCWSSTVVNVAYGYFFLHLQQSLLVLFPAGH